MLSPQEIISGLTSKFDSFPGLSTALTLAESRTSQTAFGLHRSEAVAYLAMYMMETVGRDGASGQIAAEREGEVARSYRGMSAVGVAPDDLNSNAWGAMRLRLQKECISGSVSLGGRINWGG